MIFASCARNTLTPRQARMSGSRFCLARTKPRRRWVSLVSRWRGLGQKRDLVAAAGLREHLGRRLLTQGWSLRRLLRAVRQTRGAALPRRRERRAARTRMGIRRRRGAGRQVAVRRAPPRQAPARQAPAHQAAVHRVAVHRLARIAGRVLAAQALSAFLRRARSSRFLFTRRRITTTSGSSFTAR